MTQITTLKAQASNLVNALAARGIALTKSQGLEVIAQQYGISDWDTMNGMLKKKAPVAPAPTLADMPGYPDGVMVEQGPKRRHYTVAAYEEEALALLERESELLAWLDKYHDDGLDSVAIELYGDGDNLEFTFRELQGMTYSIIAGQGTWELADGETYLNFLCGGSWSPPEGGTQIAKTPLAIPEMVKSVKKVKLIRMTSSDGDKYDLFFLAPPHLDVEVIKRKLDAEVARLKKRDEDNAAQGDEDNQYTDSDIIAFAKSLGIEPVEPETCSENWDY